MKKKLFMLFCLVILLVILFVPIPTGVMNDGGSREFSALTYKIVKWNRLIDENNTYKKTSFYIFPNNFKSIDELWKLENVCEDTNSVENVLVVLQTYNNKGLTFIINNDTENEYTYGNDYMLLVYKNGAWNNVPCKNDLNFNTIGYILKPHSATDKITIDWEPFYGNIPDGKYKFDKTILFVRSPGDYDSYHISAEFELANGESVKVSSYTIAKIENNRTTLKKSFGDKKSMTVISDAYFNAILKSTIYPVDTSNIKTIYKVISSYSNGETSENIAFEKDGTAYFAGAVCDYEMYRNMIALLD